MAFEGPHSGDIRATLALSQAEAQAGSSRILSLPGGRRITVPVHAGIRNGEEIRLRGQGEPAWSGGPVGDLILTVSIAPSEQYGNQTNSIDDPSSPTDFIPASSLPPTTPTPDYPLPYPPPASDPNYNQYGQYGSASPNYPPAGPGGSYPNYPDQTGSPCPLRRISSPLRMPARTGTLMRRPPGSVRVRLLPTCDSDWLIAKVARMSPLCGPSNAISFTCPQCIDRSSGLFCGYARDSV